MTPRSDDMDNIIQDFIIESNELLEQMEKDLLELEKDAHNLDLLNSIFRSAHTIKGSASFLGFDVLTKLTHHAEDVLNKLRKNEMEPTHEIVDMLFVVMDNMKQLLEQISKGEQESVDIADLIVKLEKASEEGSLPASVQAQDVHDDDETDADDGQPGYFKDEVLREVLQEFVIEAEENLDFLSQELVNWEKHKDNKEILNDFYRKIHTVKGSAGFIGVSQMAEVAHKIEDILNKIRDGVFTLERDLVDGMLEGIDKLQLINKDLKEGKQPQVETKSIMVKLAQLTGEAHKAEQIASDKNKDDVPVEQKNASALVKERGVEQTIRVDVKRLDQLMNLVGELVQAKNRLLRISGILSGSKDNEFIEQLSDNTANINFVTSELQMAVMKTRLLPIGKVFNKYPRMIRTLAREKNKEIDLIISGEETELDKSIVEYIGDPLVHILRNSVDHGIESPEERKRVGKPAVGTIYLSAYQEGDNIVIEVEDDGRGIDTKKIARKAIEKGVVDEASLRNMSENEILNIIFMPGFSTVEQVSNTSGRGVGMDVVRSNVQKLNGMIEITTEIGKGTKMKVRLPLTLAIVTALLVSVSDEIYSVPITSVIETSKVTRSEIRTINNKEVLNLRDMVLPLLRLSEIFEVPNQDVNKQDYYVVIVSVGGRRLGLLVDELLGREEIVIKSLSEYLGNIPGISGASTLGDGRVSLIIDVSGMAGMVKKELAGV